jgi:hypothetical protein
MLHINSLTPKIVVSFFINYGVFFKNEIIRCAIFRWYLNKWFDGKSMESFFLMVRCFNGII